MILLLMLIVYVYDLFNLLLFTWLVLLFSGDKLGEVTSNEQISFRMLLQLLSNLMNFIKLPYKNLMLQSMK